MSIRTLILALASGAVLAAAALAPVGASAKPVLGVMPHPGPGLGPVKPVLGVIKPIPGPVKPILGFKPIPMPHPILGVVIHPHPDHDHDHGGWWWWHHHESPWFVERSYPVSVPVAVSGPAMVSAPVANGPCTCLTKTYLNDGSVLFKDVCTKEAAVATPDQMRAQQ